MQQEKAKVSAIETNITAFAAGITAIQEDASMHTADAVALEMRETVRGHVSLYNDGSLKQAWDRVARRYGMTARRVRAYWGGEIKTVPAHEADAIRAAKRAIIRERQKLLNLELETLQLRLDALEHE
jgi:hypothetical protein